MDLRNKIKLVKPRDQTDRRWMAVRTSIKSVFIADFS